MGKLSELWSRLIDKNGTRVFPVLAIIRVRYIGEHLFKTGLEMALATFSNALVWSPYYVL